jgi:GNAT superfamily N-acetyltransferase
MLPAEIRMVESPAVADAELNDLFRSAWKDHRDRSFQAVLERSLAYLCAYDGELLVGFVNVAWDGGIHGFLLDTTVRDTHQHLGIGTALVGRAAAVAASRGLEWLHVDFEPHLQQFYTRCGYKPTDAGLLQLATLIEDGRAYGLISMYSI